MKYPEVRNGKDNNTENQVTTIIIAISAENPPYKKKSPGLTRW